MAPSADRLRQRRKSVVDLAKCDALFITSPFDVRYLTGCTEGAPAALITSETCTIFTTRMYQDRAPKEALGSEVVVCEKTPIVEALKHAGEQSGTLGFQDEHMSIAMHCKFSEQVPSDRQRALGSTVTDVRAVRDDEEIALTRQAVKIAEDAFKSMMDEGAAWYVGKTETELAGHLELRMRQRGADRQGFPNGIIVGVAENSAGCHHVPRGRKAEMGDAILFDWGAELEGYRSDITRVVFLGEPNNYFQKVYPIVLTALDLAIDAMAPGVVCASVDKIARDYITEQGYGDEFRHGLGHGIGLEIHENPRFGKAPESNTELEPGHIMTVEPGIYVEGEGGVRIEDDILVTQDGHERLNNLPRDLS